MRGRVVSGEQPGTVDDSAPSWWWLIDRLLWLCPAVSLIFAVALLWLVGLTLWTAVVVAVLIGCPVAVVFALLAERLGKHKSA